MGMYDFFDKTILLQCKHVVKKEKKRKGFTRLSRNSFHSLSHC